MHLKTQTPPWPAGQSGPADGSDVYSHQTSRSVFAYGCSISAPNNITKSKLFAYTPQRNTSAPLHFFFRIWLSQPLLLDCPLAAFLTHSPSPTPTASPSANAESTYFFPAAAFLLEQGPVSPCWITAASSISSWPLCPLIFNSADWVVFAFVFRT